MLTHESAKLRRDLEEIDALIEQALQNDFLPDNIYVKITTKIGTFDEAFINSHYSPADENYLVWAQARLDKICKMLLAEQIHAKDIYNENDDLMHPTGDYYNEDNSIYLSSRAKNSLKKILQDKYPRSN